MHGAERVAIARPSHKSKLLPENRSHSLGQMLRFGAMSKKHFAERSDEFWRALRRRDSSYEGIFIVGVNSPPSMVNSFGKRTNFLMVCTLAKVVFTVSTCF